ncbi:hypothetical protein [Xenorhabdus budapestensis]|uniref:Uncharacterized protein n=1 Tax=Xenorhabdus budapestensis TaxID=290110 RepID=A0A2D0IV43_XENBU|nr:hypothetical protein [Xenorhabdus budapestensis]PHM25770.1 hypothetical protein Xbud_02838 [Xenorhabdus budapestensis]
MDTDLISFEAMIAAQQSAKWAYWAMFGTWFAGIATFFAVLVALFNASAWKNQLIVKEEQLWATALMQYISCLDKCPDIITSDERMQYSTELSKLDGTYDLLLTQFASLKIALMVSKTGTNKFETKYKDKFNNFMPFHYSYICGSMERDVLLDVLPELTKGLIEFK